MQTTLEIIAHFNWQAMKVLPQTVTLIKPLTRRTAPWRNESQDAHPLDEVLSPCTALSETHITPEHKWAFPLDKQITTGLSLTHLTSGRNSQSLTDTEQDSLSQLIVSVSYKREKKNHFHLITSLIFLLCLLVLSEEVQTSLTSLTFRFSDTEKFFICLK